MQSRASTSPVQNDAPGSIASYVSPLVAVLVIVKCAWLFAEPLRSASPPLRLAQDDFYYYLKVAQNLALHGRSTFDGTTLTNGYHPLYFALLTLLSRFTQSLRGIFGFLLVLDTVCAATVFLLSRRLFARAGSVLLANVFAVLMTSLCFTLISDQMEVTLALPLGFLFLLLSFIRPEELTAKRAAAMGLAGALLFLSRLDAGLLVFLYVLGMLSSRRYRAVLTPRKVSAFAAASLPLPLLYLWSNHHFFHTLLPISGMAKQLRHGHRPSMLLPGSFSGTNQALVELSVATAILAWALRKRLASREKVFLFSVLTMPFLFYGLEMLISDWPVWNWYFYALRFSAAGMAVLAATWVTQLQQSSPASALGRVVRSQSTAAVLLAAALLKLGVAHYRVDHWMVEVQHAAGILQDFARQHPGRYAMGDRAGMFAISTANPVLQTEGLVMNRAFLQHIRSGDDLRSVLREYGVQYYVAFVFNTRKRYQFKDGCFQALEPSIAGPSSLRMRSSFCEPPVFSFPGFDGQYLVYRIDGR